MAYDEVLADRVRELMLLRSGVSERKMFGGIVFMLDGNLACGVLGDELIVRLGPEEGERALAEPDTRAFDFTGRPTRGAVVVDPGGIADDQALAAWVDAGADFAASLPAK